MSVSIKKTGIVQASGDTSPNLFIGTSYDGYAVANFDGNGTTNWDSPLRYYNGNASMHSFANGIDTITLSLGGNIGLAFQRKATDIALDSNVYYTLSCEAKCSISGAKLSIARSYYTTADAWVWRGGSNAQDFLAVDKWQLFTLTFKPDSNTQYTMYCFTCNAGSSGGTGTLCLRNCKLEKLNHATEWIPNEADEDYVSSTSGFNELFNGNASISQGYINTTDFIEV